MIKHSPKTKLKIGNFVRIVPQENSTICWKHKDYWDNRLLNKYLGMVFLLTSTNFKKEILTITPGLCICTCWLERVAKKDYKKYSKLYIDSLNKKFLNYDKRNLTK